MTAGSGSSDDQVGGEPSAPGAKSPHKLVAVDTETPVRRVGASVLADRIAAALVHREPGWRLPRRSALARRYNVSITEIDTAIGELTRRSLIRRLPDGQLYRASPAEYLIPVEGISGLSTLLDPMGGEIVCQARHVSQRAAPQDVAWALGVDGEAPVRIVRCVWAASAGPVAISTAYVPEAVAGNLAGQDTGSFESTLHSIPELTPETSQACARTVELELAPPQPSVARSLRLAPGQPAVSVTIRFDDLATRTPVGLTVVILKPDQFRVVVEIGGTASGHLRCFAGNLKWMPAEVVPGAGSVPRRARHLIPTQLPRRGEAIAACAVLVLLAHLLLAQLTLVLAIAFIGVSKASRWRLWWLAGPALVGLAWTLVIGPRAALAGFAAGPAQFLADLSRGGQSLSRLPYPRGVFAGAGNWLPRQAPIALVAASAEAALVGWVDWMHTNEWEVASVRPGAFAAVRSAVNSRAIGAGGVLTRDGCCLGVAPQTGARVVLSWQEAAGGILVTGAAAQTLTVTSLQIVHAALRRRKPVIALDMSGSAATESALAAACAATGTPLRAFGPGCYEPFRQAGPERRLAMALALIGMDDTADRSADGVRTYLRTVFELIDAVPADPGTAVLDDAAHLLNPQALQARFALVPTAEGRQDELAHLAAASVRIAREDPGTLVSAARRLAAVRQSPAGRWLCPGSDEIDLARVVRERSAALFRVDDPGVAALVCADIAAVEQDLLRIGVDGDGLCWLCGCDSLPPETLSGLVAGGGAAGLPVLLTSASPATADPAARMNAVIIHQLADEAAAASLAARTGARLVPDATAVGQPFVPRPAVPEQALRSLAPAQFVLAVNSPRQRLVWPGQVVPARLPRRDHLVRADGEAGP